MRARKELRIPLAPCPPGLSYSPVERLNSLASATGLHAGRGGQASSTCCCCCWCRWPEGEESWRRQRASSTNGISRVRLLRCGFLARRRRRRCRPRPRCYFLGEFLALEEWRLRCAELLLVRGFGWILTLLAGILRCLGLGESSYVFLRERPDRKYRYPNVDYFLDFLLDVGSRCVFESQIATTIMTCGLNGDFRDPCLTPWDRLPDCVIRKSWKRSTRLFRSVYPEFLVENWI